MITLPRGLPILCALEQTIVDEVLGPTPLEITANRNVGNTIPACPRNGVRNMTEQRVRCLLEMLTQAASHPRNHDFSDLWRELLNLVGDKILPGHICRFLREAPIAIQVGARIEQGRIGPGDATTHAVPNLGKTRLEEEEARHRFLT